MKNIRVVSAERDRTEKIFLLVCSIALVISAVLGICMGSVKIPLSDFISALFFDENTVNSQIIYSVRMPRVAASVLAGIALAVSGVIIQSVLENPLAAPSIIGVNSGAGFFAVLGSYYNGNDRIFHSCKKRSFKDDARIGGSCRQ